MISYQYSALTLGLNRTGVELSRSSQQNSDPQEEEEEEEKEEEEERGGALLVTLATHRG